MADLVLRVGGNSSQGIRPNNEDRFVVDLGQKLFLVADGMGGQERGELASGMAAELLPQYIYDRLAAHEPAEDAMRGALARVNAAIVDAGLSQPEGRRMGTTAVIALHCRDRCYVAGLGDSRAYLIRDGKVEQLTMDHSVAQELVRVGALLPEEARTSPYQHVLHKFLGCASMNDGAEVYPFEPRAGDRLLLGSDGLTNHVNDDDLIQGAKNHADPQEWADRLVRLALDRGSRDNVTCVIVAFDGST